MIDFFRSEAVTPHITRITDIVGTAAYLVRGEQRACLIDTCNGFGNIAMYVAEHCNLPLTVILTHGHFDHAGAAALFDQVYLDPKDEKVYFAYYSHPMKAEVIPLLEVKYGPLEENPIRNTPFTPLRDGDVFDLGGIHVKMISCAGHTPGMMMALICEERVMLFGDACGEGTLLFDNFATSISEYRKNLIRIKTEYESSYDTIIRNHGTYTSPKDLLDNVIACCEEILAGTDDHQQRKDDPSLFYAKAVNEKNERRDGQHGNICYRADKVS